MTSGRKTAIAVALLLCAGPTVAACSRGAASKPGTTSWPIAVSERTIATPPASAPPASPASGAPSAGIPLVAQPTFDVAPFLGRPLERSPRPTSDVVITLDDGPSGNTVEVLAILRRAEASATFFFVGDRIPRFRGVLADVYRQGSEIGDHTFHHVELRKLPRAAVLSEVSATQAMIQKYTGVTPVFVRPAVGHWDTTALGAVNGSGLILALWSLHGQDTGKGTHAEVIARDVVRTARGGDVILLHETNGETVKALPEIIAGLRAKGLRVVTLSRMLADGQR